MVRSGKVFIKNANITKQKDHVCVPDVAGVDVQKVMSEAEKSL